MDAKDRADLPEPPASESRYTNKFEEGQNKFRILSKPTTYWEYFNNDNKPVRSIEKPSNDEFETKCKEGKFGKQLSFVWAMPARDFQKKQLVILQMKQASVIRALKAVIADTEFGDPTKYNITVIKEKKGDITEYKVNGGQLRELEKEVLQEIYKRDVKMDELFVSGGNPFREKADKTTPPDSDTPF